MYVTDLNESISGSLALGNYHLSVIDTINAVRCFGCALYRPPGTDKWFSQQCPSRLRYFYTRFFLLNHFMKFFLSVHENNQRRTSANRQYIIL
jgi:hypothetical protein